MTLSEKRIVTYDERLSRVGDIKCWLCKNRWDGHIVLDQKCGFQLYCELCDVFIWMETGFKVFVSLGNSGKLINNDPKDLQDILDPCSEYSYKMKDHDIHKAREQRKKELTEKRIKEN